MTTSTITRRLVVGGTTLAVVCGGVFGVAGIANADTAAPSASSTPSAAAVQARAEVRAIMHDLPSTLREDVRAAEHHKTRDERKDALAKVEAKVLDGGYGTTAKTVATDLQADWSSVPKGAQHRATAIADGRRAFVLRDVRGLLHRALVGKDGTTLQQQLQSLAKSLPAAPAKEHHDSSSNGS